MVWEASVKMEEEEEGEREIPGGALKVSERCLRLAVDSTLTSLAPWSNLGNALGEWKSMLCSCSREEHSAVCSGLGPCKGLSALARPNAISV